MKIELGDKAKDIVTGFEGIVIAKSVWLTGCDQYLLKPDNVNKDGSPKEGQWFDDMCIEVIKRGAVDLRPRLEKPQKTGGPRHEVMPRDS